MKYYKLVDRIVPTRIMWVFAALVTSATNGHAQFTDLACNHDGSRLYFRSQYRMRGSEQPWTPKIFEWRPGGVRLFAARQASRPGAVSNFYDLRTPETTAAGDLVAYVAASNCSGTPRQCEGWAATADRVQANLWTNSGEPAMPAEFGRVKVSANGRYVLMWGRTGVGPRNDRIVDRQSGQSQPLRNVSSFNLYFNERAGARIVADNGTAVFATARPWAESQSNFGVVRNGRAELIPAESPLVNLTLDSAGRRAAGETLDEKAILVYDLENGALVHRVEAAEGVSEARLSADGTRLLFLSRANFAGQNDSQRLQAFMMDRDGRIQQVTRFAGDATAAALSGDGKIVFAASRNSELTRSDMDSGVTETLVPSAPYLDREQTALLVPGSLAPIRGRGLTEVAVNAGPPLPSTLAGLRLSVAGSYLPIAKVEPNTVWVQVPWELSESGQVVLETAEPGIFEDFPPRFIPVRLAPRFLDGPQPGLPAISHEDYSGEVTPANPARPGETIHFWTTGLGAVDRVVATGEASPADPPARIVSGLECEFTAVSGRTPAVVSFAGLAPGQVGVYQLTVAVPAEAVNSVGVLPNFFCTLDRLSFAARVPIRVPAGRTRGLVPSQPPRP